VFGVFYGVGPQVFFAESRERAVAEVRRANEIVARFPETISMRHLREMDAAWRAAARLALERGYVHRQALEPYVYGVRCTAAVGVIGKPVAGVPGDTVEVRREGVWINGVRLTQGAVREKDRAGRALPHPAWGRRVLGPGEFWLQSGWSERSFDSRYYGSVRRGQIRDRRSAILARRTSGG
jgi:conjugative transfer signal peptidase TraF